MQSLSPVVWSEGMHLAPHHFQAQARFFQDSQHFTLSSLLPFAHGFVGVELDGEALRNGTVSLLHARGVMPDGMPFHFPHDPLPEPIQVEELFSPTAQGLRILLALPAFRPAGANCADAGEARSNGDVRFVSNPRPVLDTVTGEDEKRVALARKNFRLVVDEEERAGAGTGRGGSPDEGDVPAGEDLDLVTLPLARVQRDGSGAFVYDPDFVPPCLQTGASRALVELLSRLVEMVDARSRSLAQERASVGADAGHGGPGELVGFWLTHAVNANLPLLRHHLSTRSTHPERVFADLSALAGALGTFSLSGDAAALPTYEHDDPGRGFRTLEAEIRKHLGTVVPTNVVSLRVQPRDGYFHTAEVVDRRALSASAHWYLGVRSSGPRDAVIAGVPRLVKVCSAKHIDRLVQEAYPGMELEHATSLPSGLSPRPGTEYFQIRRTEPCWRSVSDTGEVGIYVPGSIPDAEMELVVVMESDSN